jgi:hypothetical protein
MPEIIVIKGDDGKLAGLSAQQDKKYQKFKNRVECMTRDDSLTFSWREPRSGPYHRRHFAMVDAIFESQEKFEDDYGFRKWLEMGAGYCDWIPGPQGHMIPVPKSIDYATLDQAEFEPIHEAIFKFARSAYVRQTLWGHLDQGRGAAMVDAILREFDV